MLKNTLLQQALDHVQQTVTDRDAFERIVAAGMKVIYNQSTFQTLVQNLRQSKDPVGDTAKGMVGVLQIMARKARGTIPAPALLQAGMALLLDALDFLEQAGMLKVDAKVLDQATEDYMNALLPTVGLSGDKMNSILSQIKQVMADPQKVAQYKASLGAQQ